MWDLVKYDTAYMGITPGRRGPRATSAYPQDSITADRSRCSTAAENREHQWRDPRQRQVRRGVRRVGRSSVERLGDDPEFSFKLSDFEDRMVERVYKMDCQTNPPGGAYIANVNVKGIPLVGGDGARRASDASRANATALDRR